MPAMPLEPGMTREDEFTVEGRLLTDVGGTLKVPVLSTPGMISMIERNSTMLAREHLPDTKGTVGFEVCIKHVGGAPEGATCSVRSELTGVIDDRKLRFNVEVTMGDRTIGVGTHERRVIDLEAHANRLGAEKA
jgi:fluoroacetyl-CoA thioesterase